MRHIVAAIGFDVSHISAFFASTRFVERVWFTHSLLRAAVGAIELLIDISPFGHDGLGLHHTFVERM
jgi:hypothetical protein